MGAFANQMLKAGVPHSLKDTAMFFDPGGTQAGLHGDSPYRQEMGKYDPLGQMTGMYGGKKTRYAYDPFGLRTGMYGYTQKAAPDWGSVGYAQATAPTHAEVLASATSTSTTSASRGATTDAPALNSTRLLVADPSPTTKLLMGQ